MITPDEEQSKILQWVESNIGNASINAVAGSGKTTTLLLAIDAINSHNNKNSATSNYRLYEHPNYPWIGIEEINKSTDSYKIRNLPKTLSLPMGKNRGNITHQVVQFNFPDLKKDSPKWVFKINKKHYEEGYQKLKKWVKENNTDDATFSSILYLAFNRNVVNEIFGRLKDFNISSGTATFKTFHAFGNQLLKPTGKVLSNTFGSKKPTVPAEKDNFRKKRRIIGNYLQEILQCDTKKLKVITEKVIKATCLAQNYGFNCETVRQEFVASSSDNRSLFAFDLAKICGKYILEEQVIDYLEVILQLCEDDDEYDFEDMIWLPVILDLPIRKYDWILIDEAQDLNPCQIKLLRKMFLLYQDTRFIMVGDPDQAIYAFRGADANSFHNLEKSIEVTHEFLLSGCRRCTHVHTELAQLCTERIISSKKSKDEEGYFKFMSPEQITAYFLYENRKSNSKIKTDLILSRKNKPLVEMAFFLMKNDKSVKIIGERELFDMIENLVLLYEDKEEKYSSNFLAFLKEQEKIWVGYSANREQHSRIVFLKEYFQIIYWLFEESSRDINILLSNVQRLNEAKTNKDTIYFSSTHRAKGDEALNIWILQPTEFLPLTYQDTPISFEDMKQELHCLYVALTRCCGNTITFEDTGDFSLHSLQEKISNYWQELKCRDAA